MWADNYLLKNDERIGVMEIPVKCNFCYKIYDLADTIVIERYSDCTVYWTPCCNKQVDDREWVPRPAFTRLDNTRVNPLCEDFQIHKKTYT